MLFMPHPDSYLNGGTQESRLTKKSYVVHRIVPISVFSSPSQLIPAMPDDIVLGNSRGGKARKKG